MLIPARNYAEPAQGHYVLNPSGLEAAVDVYKRQVIGRT